MYQYSALGLGKQIRVLHLSPHLSEDDKVQGQLENVDLDTPGRSAYDAISWCWGDSDATVTICLDGQDFRIRAAAEAILRHLCVPQGKLCVWMDILCINQGDERECQQQIGLMRDVYRGADEVHIWLDWTSTRQAALSARANVEAISKHCRTATNQFEGIPDIMMKTPAGQRYTSGGVYGGLPFEPDREALTALYSARWFSRVWVIQEAILAKCALAWLLDVAVPFIDVMVAAEWLSSAEWTTYSDGDIPNKHGATEMLSLFYSISSLSMSDILSAGREFAATKPQDKVYGMLGLIHDLVHPEPLSRDEQNRPRILVDYNQPLWKVYADATRAALLHDKTLWLLQLARMHVPAMTDSSRRADSVSGSPAPDRSIDDTEWPSWVPRYDLDGRVIPSGLYYPIHNDSGAVNFRVGLLPEIDPGMPDRLLRLMGVRFDRILAVESGHTNARSIPSAWEDEQLKAAIIVADMWCLASRLPIMNSGAGRRNFVVTLLAGLNTAGEDAMQDEDIYDEFCDVVGGWREAFHRHMIERETTSMDVASHPQVSIWQTTLAKLDRLLASFSRQSEKPVHSTGLGVGILDIVCNRPFFVTRSGLPGCGPFGAKAGDMVCVLVGGNVPFILRTSGNEWTLIGDAYMPGIMNGEWILRIINNGSLAMRLERFSIA